MSESDLPVAMTIAGSDPSGGAGMQSDLKTFQRFGVYGANAVTLLTVQNTRGVESVDLLEPAFVQAQIAAIATDLGVQAAKTGALGSAAIIRAVAESVESHQIEPLVVDPVMISKHGHPLISPDAVEVLKTALFPLATLITPNLHEAGELLGRPVGSLDDMERAATELVALGPKAVLVKGGSFGADESPDVLFDGESCQVYSAPRIDTLHTHGTGCAYSAAITALLAKGEPLPEAVRQAKAFITEAIAKAPGLGGGHGPINHLI